MKRKEINRIVEYFEKREEVSAFFLFGSFDTGRERPDSDIDLAVLIDPIKGKEIGYGTLKAEYYNASPGFGLQMVDIVLLNTAATALKHEILRTGRIIFDRNPDFRKAFTARTLQEYFDYKPIEETYFTALRGRLARSVNG